jgi:FkbM family methyltransferase
MKDKIILKDEKWVWPIIDENAWKSQNEFKDLSNHILPYVKNKNVMVQAGGNCGFILSTFISHFNIIYTFEPDPVNFYCLNQNVVSTNVIKMQCCLGNNLNTVNVSQLIRPERLHDTGGLHVTGAGFIPTIILDNLNLTDCNLIQLDIEGYEFNALLGAIETIKKFKPVLCIEFCEKWLNRYNTNSKNIFDLLNKLNYKLVASYGVDKIFISNEL